MISHALPRLEALPGTFAIAKIKEPSDIRWTDPFVFIGKTDEELSLVAPEPSVPADASPVERGYRLLRVCGPLDMSLTGILSGISAVLAEARIPIFAVSTWNTDYILIRGALFEAALRSLEKAGYSVNRSKSST